MINSAVFERHNTENCYIIVVYEILDNKEALVSSIAVGDRDFVERIRNQYPSDRTIIFPIFNTKDLGDKEL